MFSISSDVPGTPIDWTWWWPGGRHRATDCEDTLSPVGWHLDGRAKGFYVGVYRATLDADSAHVDFPDQFACAYSETAEPTAKAIGDLIYDALPNAAIHPAGWHE